MKARLNRDEQGFSKIPENNNSSYHSATFNGQQQHLYRHPSDMIQTEIENPMMNLQNFKPALDEFLKYGPSSDVDKFKNLAAEIAAMNSKLDPSLISTEIDANYGILGTSMSSSPTAAAAAARLATIPANATSPQNQQQQQQFGPQSFSLSRDTLGFSINSFSSLVDFGDLDATKSRNESSWQQSVNELMPASGDVEKYHKEYKVYESNDAKRVTSKDWTIDYSMNSQTFTPTHEGTSELTNNVITYVQLNEMDNQDDDYKMPSSRMPRTSGNNTSSSGRSRNNNNNNPYYSDEKRQMSVDIKTASIGIDNEGRLGSYELMSTNLQMQQWPNHMGNDNWDPDPLPPDGYRVDPLPINAPSNYHHDDVDDDDPMHDPNNYNPQHDRTRVDYRHHQQHPDPVYHRQNHHHFGLGAGHSFPVSYQRHHEQQQQHEPQPMQFGPVSPSQAPVSPLSHTIMNNNHPQPEYNAHLQQQNSSSGDVEVIAPFEITQGDVLLERGGKGNHHKGSRYYRRLINGRRESYQELPDASRAEKMAISLSVVMSVKATGARFIHKKKGKYIIMTDREARNKISQALREKKERVMLDA